jgi:hypothetical protein
MDTSGAGAWLIAGWSGEPHVSPPYPADLPYPPDGPRQNAYRNVSSAFLGAPG